MIVQDILVHLKSHEAWSPHIDLAIGTAKTFDAQLRGMVTFSDASVMRSLSVFPDDAITEQIAKDAKVAAALEEKFTAACKSAGVKGTFAMAEGPASEVVPWAARMHDLTIIEQLDPSSDELGYDAAEETTLSAGRPVIVVPRIGHFRPAPKHILLAWNGSQQSAAAVHGALPFFEQADRVTVCKGELRSPMRGSIRVPEIDIVSHLRRHVKDVGQEEVNVGGAGVGEHLLKRANELGCEMLVMGAYGRSWFSEFILGGATRYVFEHMSIPVLMGR